MLSENIRSHLQEEMVALIPAMRAFSRTFHRNAEDADDLVQETLQKALNSLETFVPGTRLRSWLFTIMRNSFNTSFRRKKREPTGTKADIAETAIPHPASQEWCLRGRELEEALYQLRPEFREPIMLICVAGVSYEEASVICGCPVGTVKSRLNRGKQQLLHSLGQVSRNSVLEA